MSKKTQALSAARGAGKAAGGAHLTKQARMRTLQRLFKWLQENNYQVSGMDTLRERHIAAFITDRRKAGINVRTLQNETAHIRAAMRAAGRRQAAYSATISNEALGIAGSSRKGTKAAPRDDQYQDALTLASELDAGLAAVLMLERALGLRSAEAVRAGPSLDTWRRELEAGNRLTIVFGTKGGRPRDSLAADVAQAIEAVDAAQQVAAARGGKLIAARTLRQAMTWYRNQMHRRITSATGFTGHALRYAYAGDRLVAYDAGGYSPAEARALTSIDLGHGDGRGRYVQSVYASQEGRPAPRRA